MNSYQVTYRPRGRIDSRVDIIYAPDATTAAEQVKACAQQVVVESCYPMEYRVTNERVKVTSVYRDRRDAESYMRSLVSSGIPFSFSLERA